MYNVIVKGTYDIGVSSPFDYNFSILTIDKKSTGILIHLNRTSFFVLFIIKPICFIVLVNVYLFRVY